MYLVNKENVTLREICKKRGKVALLFYGGAARYAKIYVKLGGNYSRERGLSETRRAVEKTRVKRVSAHFCGLYIDIEIFLYLVLTYVVGQCLWSE